MTVLRRHWPLLVLVVLATVWLSWYGLKVHSFQNDEEYYLQLSRWMSDNLPGSLWDTHWFDRGVQRLNVWVMALGQGLFRAPLSFQLTRIAETLLYVSAAIPAYLLAAGLGARRWFAYGAATLAVVLPWAVITSSYLNESLAYGAFAWALLAIWRSVVAPSLVADLCAVIAIAVAALSRTGLIVLVPVWPIALLLQMLRFGYWRRLPVTAWRTHPLLVVLGVVGVAGLLAGAGQSALGVYGAAWNLPLSLFTERFPHQLARLVTGTGILAGVVAAPWLLTNLLRPRDERTFAFAVVTLAAGFALLYSIHVSGYDERYYMYLALPVVVAAVVALSRGELSPASVAISGVLMGLLVWRVQWFGIQDDYQYLNFPAEAFWSRAVFGRIGQTMGGDVSLLAGIGVVGVVSLLALGIWRTRRPTAVATASVAIIVVASLAQTGYTLSKYAHTAGAADGPGWEQRSWVDRLVPAGPHVAILADAIGNSGTYVTPWRDIQFWNGSVDRTIGLTDRQIPLPLGTRYQHLTLDERTGALTMPDQPPGYVLVPQLFERIGFVGKTIAGAGYLPVALVRLQGPPRLAYAWTGTELDGWLTETSRRAALSIYRDGVPAQRPCLQTLLLAPPLSDGRRHRWRLTGPGIRRSGSLGGAQSVNLFTPLSPAAFTGQRLDLRLTARDMSPYVDGRTVGVRIGGTSLVSCPA